MSRKESERDIGKLIRSVNGDWKKFEDRRYCPQCHRLIYRVDNQPYDGIGVIGGLAFPIEIKSAKLNFPFADIKDHQREALTAWAKKHDATSWFALQMGTGNAGSQESNLPRRLWLIPWGAWLDFEKWMKNEVNQLSLPYDWRYGKMRIAIRTAQAGAVQVLWEYELLWVNGAWMIPTDHLFRLMYMEGQTK